MKLRRLLTIASMAITCGAMAQAPSQKRIDAIWAAADERFLRQQDQWFEDGDFPTTIQLLRFQYGLFPHDYETATNLGWMLENIEDWTGAVDIYKNYRIQNPTDPDRALPEADYYFRKKQFQKSLELLASTISSKSHPNAFRILAHSYDRLKRYKESIAVWERYIALAPNDLTAKNNLKRVQQKLKGSG